MGNQVVDPRFYQLLEELQAVQFVLVELNLYLDTHPNDQEALNQFNLLVSERGQLLDEFENLFGPLFNFGLSTSNIPWQWVNEPWPWQV